MAARALHGWLDDGNEVVAFWSTLLPRHWRRDRRLRWFRRDLSVRSALSRAGIVPQSFGMGRTMVELVAEIGRLQPDAVVSLGFTRRIRAEILNLLPGRCVNLHPALLPAYRGPSPTWAMIMDGRLAADDGATLHVVDEGFDTGPIIAARPVPPDALRNPIRYTLAVADDIAALLVEDLPRYLAGDLKAVRQDPAHASHRRVDRADLVVRPDMDRQTVARIVDAIPWTARLTVQAGERRILIDSLLSEGPRTDRKDVKLTWRWIELDVADGRVRLARRTFWRKWVRQLRIFTILLRV